MRHIDKIVIHHSEKVSGDTNEIRKWHVGENGWDDVGYHFVILNGILSNGVTLAMLDGSIEVARPLQIQGAHAYGANRGSIGICLIGNGKFTDKQITNLLLLICDLMVEFGISKQNVIGHYEVHGTTKTCPNFDVQTLIRDRL